MAKIYVGYSLTDTREVVAATSKAGLAKILGINVATVRRNLGGTVWSDNDCYWFIQECELVRIERGGKPGKAGEWSGGFRGLKGKDGLLVTGVPGGRKLV